MRCMKLVASIEEICNGYLPNCGACIDFRKVEKFICVNVSHLGRNEKFSFDAMNKKIFIA